MILYDFYINYILNYNNIKNYKYVLWNVVSAP